MLYTTKCSLKFLLGALLSWSLSHSALPWFKNSVLLKPRAKISIVICLLNSEPHLFYRGDWDQHLGTSSVPLSINKCVFTSIHSSPFFSPLHQVQGENGPDRVEVFFILWFLLVVYFFGPILHSVTTICAWRLCFRFSFVNCSDTSTSCTVPKQSFVYAVKPVPCIDVHHPYHCGKWGGLQTRLNIQNNDFWPTFPDSLILSD